jgi:electron transfer flavoprotein alpha subunit
MTLGRIAVLVKQVPKFEAMELGPDGRLVREGLELEMNPYCRRAVAKGVELAREHGGRCTVFTVGPPAAEDTLREAVAWGADDAVLVSDPAMAGSDTLATARALAAALEHEGPYDLILTGRNSVDADTGQVPPQLAELLDLPLLSGVRQLEVRDEGWIWAHCEHDDGWVDAEARLPALLSCAERLCDPCKVPPEGRAAVDPSTIKVLTSAHLGEGPWGLAGSPTTVGEVELRGVSRTPQRLEGTVAEQVAAAVDQLEARGAVGQVPEVVDEAGTPVVIDDWDRGEPLVVVLLEPKRMRSSQALLGEAAQLAQAVGGRVVGVLESAFADLTLFGSWGADHLVLVEGSAPPADVARAVAGWAAEHQPWAVLAPGTMWGREVAGRVSAHLGAGLTGDAVEMTVQDGRLVAWKPAFGGALMAAIVATSPTQLVTVRPGILPVRSPRPVEQRPSAETLKVVNRGRVVQLRTERDDEVDDLATAQVVVGIGKAVPPERYGELDELLSVLGAELAATRKVTDLGWLPRARQLGITGRSISPRLYLAIGTSGKFNHLVGVRAAGTIVAINPDPEAPVHDASDLAITGSWDEVVPALVAELRQRGFAADATVLEAAPTA